MQDSCIHGPFWQKIFCWSMQESALKFLLGLPNGYPWQEGKYS
jgi:hypothetical protein